MATLITNKYEQSLPERVGDNAKRLETLLAAVNWRRLIVVAAWLHVSFLLFLFTTIAVIRLALHLF